MNSPRVVRSLRARRDISELYQGLADEVGAAAADAIVARISKAIDRAASRPLHYRKRTEFLGAPRRINVFRYAIFFDLLPEGDGIYVWRVVHGARNLPPLVRRP